MREPSLSGHLHVAESDGRYDTGGASAAGALGVTDGASEVGVGVGAGSVVAGGGVVVPAPVGGGVPGPSEGRGAVGAPAGAVVAPALGWEPPAEGRAGRDAWPAAGVCCRGSGAAASWGPVTCCRAPGAGDAAPLCPGADGEVTACPGGGT